MKETPDMLAHRERGWSIVRESLRRERRINDLLAASSAARLAKRVATSGRHGHAWQSAERDLRLIERDIRRLDPSAPEFWQWYDEQELRLVARFAEAGIDFEPPLRTNS